MSHIEPRQRTSINKRKESYQSIEDHSPSEEDHVNHISHNRSQIEFDKLHQSTQESQGKVLFPKARFISKKVDQKQQQRRPTVQDKHGERGFAFMRNGSIFSVGKRSSSQIADEWTPKNDLLTRKREPSQSNPLKTLQNSFNDSPSQNSFSDNGQRSNIIFNNGPRFDPQGQLIPYSVVGRPEWYLSAQDEVVTTRRSKETETPGSRRGSLMFQITMASKAISQFKVRDTPEIASRIDRKKKVIVSEPGKQISKEQLLHKIEIYEKRIQKNKESEEREILKKPFFERTKEEKQCHQLSQYDNRRNQWNTLNGVISSKLQRPPSSNLFKSSVQNFRQKKEIIQAIEHNKSPSEMLGDKFWEATLRNGNLNYTQDNSYQVVEERNSQSPQKSEKSHPQEQFQQSFMRELSYTKGSKIQVAFKNEYEIIKQPKLLQVNSSCASNSQNYIKILRGDLNNSQNHTNRIHFPTEESQKNAVYENGNMQQNEIKNNKHLSQSSLYLSSYSQFPKMQRTLTNISQNENSSFEKMSQYASMIALDVDELIVKGENKLQSEKRALINDGNPRFGFYRQFNEEELEQREQQVSQKTQYKVLKNDHKQFSKESVKSLSRNQSCENTLIPVVEISKQSSFLKQNEKMSDRRSTNPNLNRGQSKQSPSSHHKNKIEEAQRIFDSAQKKLMNKRQQDYS